MLVIQLLLLTRRVDYKDKHDCTCVAYMHFITHAGIAAGVGMAFSCVCLCACLFVRDIT